MLGKIRPSSLKKPTNKDKYHLAMEKKTINLLLFHGSARANSLESALAFTQKLCDISGRKVECCFLRGQQPTLEMALASAVNEGYNMIRLIQLFLLPGSHVDEDIPGIIEGFRQKHPEVKIESLPCLVELEGFASMLAAMLE